MLFRCSFVCSGFVGCVSELSVVCVWGVVWGFSGLAVWNPPSPSSGTLKFFALALLVCEFEVICRALIGETSKYKYKYQRLNVRQSTS